MSVWRPCVTPRFVCVPPPHTHLVCRGVNKKVVGAPRTMLLVSVQRGGPPPGGLNPWVTQNPWGKGPHNTGKGGKPPFGRESLGGTKIPVFTTGGDFYTLGDPTPKRLPWVSPAPRGILPGPSWNRSPDGKGWHKSKYVWSRNPVNGPSSGWQPALDTLTPVKKLIRNGPLRRGLFVLFVRFRIFYRDIRDKDRWDNKFLPIVWQYR